MITGTPPTSESELLAVEAATENLEEAAADPIDWRSDGQSFANRMNAILQEQAADRAAIAAIKRRKEQDEPNIPEVPTLGDDIPKMPAPQPLAIPPTHQSQDATSSWTDAFGSAQLPNGRRADLSKEPETLADAAAPLAALAIILTLAAYIEFYDGSLRKVWSIMKRRGAFVACIGAGIVAFSIFVADNMSSDRGLWHEIVSNGWLSMFGAALALLGTYHWIVQSDMK